jgi:hypothetical protein
MDSDMGSDEEESEDDMDLEAIIRELEAQLDGGEDEMEEADEAPEENPDAVIVCIICDRGDRYLSTGLFSVQD